MTLKFYRRHFILVYLVVLPFAGYGTPDEVVNEKMIKVAMRMMGHEILSCLGDYESRVLPIEKNNEQYKISFESEFGFDPDDMTSIINRVIAETRITRDYIVEIEQCEPQIIVHSFAVGKASNLNFIPCKGRVVPSNCYSILITILDGIDKNKRSSGDLDAQLLKAEKKSLFSPIFLVVLLLITLGLVRYYLKKRNTVEEGPNLILIGSSQFDRRKMTLSFENRVVELSNKEAELLTLLHASVNAPIGREVILQRVWGDDGDYVGRTLDVYISKLRKKLEPDKNARIVNIRGIGYKLISDLPPQSFIKSLFLFFKFNRIKTLNQ